MVDPTVHDHPSTLVGDGTDVTVTRSAERLDLSTRSEVSGRVRLVKRVVTEQRTVTVAVRREELVVEYVDEPGATFAPHPAPSASADSAAPAGERVSATVPFLELLLQEEEVEVVTRVVPRELVKVYVDAVTEMVAVEETLAHEVIDVQTGDDASAG